MAERWTSVEWVDPFRFEFPEQLTLTTYRISIEHIWTYCFLGANDDKWCVFPFYIFNTHSLGGDEPSRESGGWSGACERAGTELEPEQLMRQTMPFASVCYRLLQTMNSGSGEPLLCRVLFMRHGWMEPFQLFATTQCFECHRFSACRRDVWTLNSRYKL